MSRSRGSYFKTPHLIPILMQMLLCLSSASAQEGVPCPPEPTNMPIVYGDLVSCMIESVGDSDLFTFTGTTGDGIVAQVAGTGGFGNPCIEIFRPDASVLASLCDFNNPRVDIILDQTGTHTILVSDDNDDETMSYALALERILPVVDSGTPINYGGLQEDQIEPVGDLDLFTFTGTTGDGIVAQVAGTGGFGNPCIEIFRPDASVLASQCEFNNPRVDITLDQTGTHTILVSDDNDDEAMSYSIVVDTIAPLSCSARHICFGCTTGDLIEPIGDLDFFSFFGTTGDLILLTTSGVSGFGNPCMELFSPDGTLIEAACDFNNAMLDETLSQTGIYTVLISDDNDDETFAYDVNLQCIGECQELETNCGLIFSDGFESGDTSAWSKTLP